MRLTCFENQLLHIEEFSVDNLTKEDLAMVIESQECEQIVKERTETH